MNARTRRPGRGLLILGVVLVWAFGMAAAVAVLVVRGVDDASKWAGVLGALTALAGFSAPLAERVVHKIEGRRAGSASASEEASVLAGVADGLSRAIQVQWRDEARIRRLQDPWPLPVSWLEADAEIADHAALVLPSLDPSGASPVSAGLLGEVVDAYVRLPHRRMVVIGEPGSGKSVFSMVMALQLVERRRPGDVVPVIFPMGSWDASVSSLRDWLCDYLTENY